LTGSLPRGRAGIGQNAYGPESDFSTPYDVEAIRRDFPILTRQKCYGKPLVYLDNGASAQKPQVVLDAIQHAYSQEYANVHRGLHFPVQRRHRRL
jgi:cysteine desulfurase/selenocysteine lyase